MLEIKFTALSPKIGSEIPYPKYQTEGSAGMDLSACIDEEVVILPGKRALIDTKIAISLPSHEYVAIICARSGLAIKHGIALSNGIGVIDSDYRGEIKVGLINTSDQPFTIKCGERIAQMMILPVTIAKLTLVESLDETERGSGGFGSTGTN